MEMLGAWMMNGDLIPSARERKKESVRLSIVSSWNYLCRYHLSTYIRLLYGVDEMRNSRLNIR
jgi:hypothetical protein